MNRIEELNMERSTLKTNLQLLVKENLEATQRKKEIEIERRLLENEARSLNSKIRELKAKINSLSCEYSYDKENKLFNKVIACNLIPWLSLGGLLLATGNAHIITDLGVFSSVFTGLPTLFISSGIYMADLKNIRAKNKEEYMSSSECDELNNKVNELEREIALIDEKKHQLRYEFNKAITTINSRGCRIALIKNRISRIENEIRFGSVQEENEESIKLVR